jgi:hypothetical protein
VPQELLRELANAFADLFNSESALDIIALSADQESDLRRVCSPFFEQAD